MSMNSFTATNFLINFHNINLVGDQIWSKSFSQLFVLIYLKILSYLMLKHIDIFFNNLHIFMDSFADELFNYLFWFVKLEY